MSNHEKMDYVEFPCRNIPATQAFFQKAFSWSFEDYGPDYTSFANEGLNGGFFRSEMCAQTQTGSALIVFYSHDITATYNRILDAGGKIVQSIFEFPGGRRFHFTEPSGNEFAVWSDIAPATTPA